jgi:D-beta-D-heptose 7-phosphate kinase/D-beta-D-heptose 1-phosphate adenosyltransferase
MNLQKAKSLLERFSSLKVLIVGDLMLDHFIWGAVSRISPEAPVPVVDVNRETEVPGGSGNVAANMAALGATVHLVAVMGEDPAAERLLSLLQNANIRTTALVRSADRPTIVKTRVIAQHQQVVRFDREKRSELPASVEKELWNRIETLLPQSRAIILSDYAKGVLSARLISRLVSRARASRIPVTVDPKVENFRRYKRVTCVTPNTLEAMQSGGVARFKSPNEIEGLGWKLQRLIGADSVLITRGEQGMSLFEKNKPAWHIPTRAREVFDVTGAGDTVIAVLTLALAAGASLRMAAELANFAAGIVVAKLGTASVSAEEILKAIRSHHG